MGISDMLGKFGTSGKSDTRDPEAEAEARENDQQLVELFNKRNELKRAFDRTASERDQLLSEVTTLRKSHAEMSHKLDNLEKALANPLTGPSVLAYYSLSKCWLTCQQYLADAAVELRGKFEEDERGVLLQQFRKRQESELAAVNTELESVNARREELQNRKRALEQDLHRAAGLFGLFRRKKINAELSGVREELDPLEKQYRDLLEKLEEIRDREAPRYSGMSRAAMRNANLHLIALTQYFYIRLAVDDVSSRIHEAHGKLPHEVNYGGPQTCLELQKKVHALLAALIEDPDRSALVRERAQILRKSVRYESDKDVVPESASLNSIELSGREKGLVEQTETLIANILELDSWNLTKYLFLPESGGKEKKPASRAG